MFLRFSFLIVFLQFSFGEVIGMEAFCEMGMKIISRQLDENIIGKLTYLPRLMKMEVSDREEVLQINTGISSDMFNVACMKKVCSDLQPIHDIFLANRLPFAWWIGFGDKGMKCKEAVQKLGIEDCEVETGMFVNIEKMTATHGCDILKILQVVDSRTLRDFIIAYRELIPMDGEAIDLFYSTSKPFILDVDSKLKLFVGYIADRPVSTAALFLSSDVAGVWDVTVLPDFRRMGIATDMVSHVMFEARSKHGCNVGVLTASELGEKVYSKMGFQRVKDFYIFNVK